jgi:hypothetical protein
MKKHIEEEIQQRAYWIWRELGCQDGEEIIECYLGEMKRKDYHWQLAKNLISKDHQSGRSRQ